MTVEQTLFAVPSLLLGLVGIFWIEPLKVRHDVSPYYPFCVLTLI